MVYGAKNSNVKVGNWDVDYNTFGSGAKNLVIIPGLSDGLKTVKGAAAAIAMMYRMYAKDYKVYVFSRKNQMEAGYSTRDMARDLKRVLEVLNIQKAHIIGISQGGMIAQYLAIDYPEVVDKLVLEVSVSRQNETIQKVIGSMVTLAEQNDYKGIIVNTTEKTYSEKKVRTLRLLYPILSRIGRPKSLDRFIIQAKACLNHNAYDALYKIKSPTLVIGGDRDLIVGPNASEEMAEKIPNSKLIICKGFGHGAFEEDKQFNDHVLNLLKS